MKSVFGVISVSRNIIRPVVTIVSAFALLALAGCAAPPYGGWEKYSGAWFDISYPAAFKVVPVQKSLTSLDGFDSARFISPSDDVEFYVFSPQWSGHASALDIDPRREHVVSKKVSVSDWRLDSLREKDAVTDTWLCIAALDKSYVRFVHDHFDSIQNGDLVFGITCKDMQSYSRHMSNYKKFRKSLVQYAD